MHRAAEDVVSQYELQIGSADQWRLTYLAGAGGFSGARFWRLDTGRGPFCLRRWPKDQPSLSHLSFIHESLRWAAQRGFDRFPLPLPNKQGETFVQHRSHLWEVSRWLKGKADFHGQPSSKRLKNAAVALAEYHAAMRSYPGNHTGPCHSLTHRREVLGYFRGGGAAEIGRRLLQIDVPWRDGGLRLLQLFAEAASDLARQLGEYERETVELQPCVRDVWHDHILFVGDEVTGIVDVGAMRYDDRATDVARLFGSLAGDDRSRWETAWEAYSEGQVIEADFRDRVTLIDRANVVLAGLNWLKWLHLDEREFEDYSAIADRLTETRLRFEHLMRGEGTSS